MAIRVPAAVPVLTITLLSPTVAPSLGKEPEEHSPHTHSEQTEVPVPVGHAVFEYQSTASSDIRPVFVYDAAADTVMQHHHRRRVAQSMVAISAGSSSAFTMA